ncbi:MAG TPA: DUF5814 domain-containing protein, partial [Candidatus Hodarchaeales archaeon]|nr:DUF5814 domain-containing protein [Candidatus Hodarchaeales archaeon]
KEYLVDNPNIYFQMQGRAGRLGKHDKGKAVLLVTPFPPHGGSQASEIDMAMALLRAKKENIIPAYGEEVLATQMLATMAFFGECTKEILFRSCGLMLGVTGALDESVETLGRIGLTENIGQIVKITPLGQAGANSFLAIEEIQLVLDLLNNGRGPLDIAIMLDPLENIHLSPQIIGFLERGLGTRVKTRLFSSNVLELFHRTSGKLEKLDPKVVGILTGWYKQFFNCKCSDRPYCDCGMININRKLLEYRMDGNSPAIIAKRLSAEHNFSIFAGDALRWLESIIYKLEGVRSIAGASKFSTEQMSEISHYVRAIQTGGGADQADQHYEGQKVAVSERDRTRDLIGKTRSNLKLGSEAALSRELPDRILQQLRQHRKKIHMSDIPD